MSDFHQPSALVTLHLLEEREENHLDADLLEFTRERPLALLLPCHADEIGTPGFKKILGVLRQAPYLSSIYIGLDGADTRAADTARREFSNLPAPVCLLHNDSREILDVLGAVGETCGQVIPRGKGTNLWLIFGAALAAGGAHAFVAHDCDIQTYSRAFLARLCFPVAFPDGGFLFAKGYGARFTDRMHGRVMRLLLTPLLRALRTLLPGDPLLAYLDSFRYPLSGEFGIAAETARQLDMPGNWGVDIAVLSELFGRLRPDSICQVECCMRFEHKHRALMSGDGAGGLDRMAGDVALRIFQTLQKRGAGLTPAFFDNLLGEFRKESARLARAYEADSRVNGLVYDREAESAAAAAFEQSTSRAVARFLREPAFIEDLPSWETLGKKSPEIQCALGSAAGKSFL